MTRAATARFGLVLLVVVGLLTAAVAVGTRSPGPPGATLTVFTGRASITHAGTTRSAASGDVARDGDVVATAAGGRAALAYPDGSSTRLDVASTLTVHLDGTSVRVEQTAGLTWNRVRALAAGAGFRVDGPASSSAVVRGTLLGFYIEHDPAGLPVVWVDTWEGSVDVGGAGGRPSGPRPGSA